jgi:hypothetical protein
MVEEKIGFFYIEEELIINSVKSEVLKNNTNTHSYSTLKSLSPIYHEDDLNDHQKNQTISPIGNVQTDYDYRSYIVTKIVNVNTKYRYNLNLLDGRILHFDISYHTNRSNDILPDEKYEFLTTGTFTSSNVHNIAFHKKLKVVLSKINNYYHVVVYIYK